MTEPQNESRPEALIAFVGFFPTADGQGWLGAAMVTNERGYPLEFRVSTAVRPSGVQRALYGKSLEPYVVSELVGARLVKELQRRPDIVLVNRLTALEAISRFPLAFVAHADSHVQTADERLDYRRVELDGAPASALALVRLRGGSDEPLLKLKLAIRHFDPVEAFDRMQTAVTVLGEADERYR